MDDGDTGYGAGKSETVVPCFFNKKWVVRQRRITHFSLKKQQLSIGTDQAFMLAFLFDLGERIEAAIQKSAVFIHIGRVAARFVQEGFAVVVHEGVPGLRVAAKVVDLETGPFVADRTHFFVGVGVQQVFEFIVGKQAGLVVDVQRYHHVIVAQVLENFRFVPHGFLHFAAVDAAVAGEIDKQRFVFQLRHFQGFVKIMVAIEAVRAVDRAEKIIVHRRRDTAQERQRFVIVQAVGQISGEEQGECAHSNPGNARFAGGAF